MMLFGLGDVINTNTAHALEQADVPFSGTLS